MFPYNFDLISTEVFLNVSLAQPVEHLPFKEVAVGSNPTGDTISGRLAQLVERYPYKVDVTGSSPVVPTILR